MKKQVQTTQRESFHDVTDALRDCARSAENAVIVFTQHTSCAVLINENTDGTCPEDIHEVLREVAPWTNDYDHNVYDDNAAAHVKASIIGQSITIPVENGEALLGTWQRVLLIEFDGPRKRCVLIHAV